MKIENYIEFYRMRNAVNAIVELLFDGDEYCPELYDYAFWVTISNLYADVGSEMEIDEFMQKLYSGWMEELKGAINEKQLDSIRIAVDKKIDAKLNRNPLIDALTELVKNLNTKWNNDDIKTLIDIMKETKKINAEDLVEAYKNQK